MVALVTGASSGIGRDIAIELAKIKYTVNVTSSVDRVQQEASPAF